MEIVIHRNVDQRKVGAGCPEFKSCSRRRDDNDNPRPFQSSGHVNTCSKIPFHGPGHMTVLGQGSTSGWRAFAFYYYHRHYLLSLSPCNEMVGGKEGRGRSTRPTDSTQILDKAPIQPITWISNVFTYRVMRFNTYLINLLNYLLGLSVSFHSHSQSVRAIKVRILSFRSHHHDAPPPPPMSGHEWFINWMCRGP